MTRKIRVLRLMEYVYDDAERMVEDMSRWSVGSQEHYSRMSVRSTTLPPEILEEDDR